MGARGCAVYVVLWAVFLFSWVARCKLKSWATKEAGREKISYNKINHNMLLTTMKSSSVPILLTLSGLEQCQLAVNYDYIDLLGMRATFPGIETTSGGYS